MQNKFNSSIKLFWLNYKETPFRNKSKNQTKIKNKIIKKFVKNFFLVKEIILKKNYLIINQQKWFFSFSYSHGKALGAFSLFPIGVDLQKMKVIKNYEKIIKYHFNLSEKKIINKYENKFTRFIQIWTMKESFYKCYFNFCKKLANFAFWKLVLDGKKKFYYSNKKDKTKFVGQIYQLKQKYIYSICQPNFSI